MIITVEEVQRMLTIKDINLSDEKVEGLIEYYTNKIVGLTGINLDVSEYHYTIENKRLVKKIVLPLYNIFDVDQIHVDYKLINDKDYFVDYKNGVVFFKETIPYAEHIHIKYLTKIDDNLMKNVIIPLLIDMIIDGENPSSNSIVNGDVTSIHEGNTSISFSNSTSLKSSIQSRLDKLASGEFTGIGNNKKGAMFL